MTAQLLVPWELQTGQLVPVCQDSSSSKTPGLPSHKSWELGSSSSNTPGLPSHKSWELGSCSSKTPGLPSHKSWGAGLLLYRTWSAHYTVRGQNVTASWRCHYLKTDYGPKLCDKDVTILRRCCPPGVQGATGLPARAARCGRGRWTPQDR